MCRKKSSADHSLGVILNEETHGDLRFYSFQRPDTVLDQTPRVPWAPLVLPGSSSSRSDPPGPRIKAMGSGELRVRLSL